MIDKLIKKIIEKQNPSVIGLDTCLSYLPEDMQNSIITETDLTKALVKFNSKIIEKIAPYVPAVKIQAACYEQYGISGLIAFKETIECAKASGLIVITDVKRNDIGSTAECYSRAYLSGTKVNKLKISDFKSHFITVNAYLGIDGIKPFIDDCVAEEKGIFVLVKTSNASSFDIQDKELKSGEKIYELMGANVQKWGKELIGKYGYSSVGAVVGATHPNQAKILRNELNSVFFLIPGYGAQGGKASDITDAFDKKGLGGIVNSSRNILCAYRTSKFDSISFDESALGAVLDMKEDLNSALKQAGKAIKNN